MKTLKPLCVLAFLAVTFSVSAQTKSGFHVIKTLPIGGAGGWDYVTVDAAGKKIYVSHGNQVHVLSTNGDTLGIIANTAGVHGIAIAKPFNKGYTSNGRANNTTV